MIPKLTYNPAYYGRKNKSNTFILKYEITYSKVNIYPNFHEFLNIYHKVFYLNF